MIRVGIVFGLLFSGGSGCAYLSARATDFGDCWRGELHGGFMLGGWAEAGPVMHAGLGIRKFMFSGTWGWRYGYPEGETHGHGALPQEGYGGWIHEHQMDYNTRGHRCYVLFPPLLTGTGGPNRWLHAFDLEAGGGFLVGATAGFSPGEFLDFLLGWFGVDIAGDDGDGDRTERTYARDRGDRNYLAPEAKARDSKPPEK